MKNIEYITLEEMKNPGKFYEFLKEVVGKIHHIGEISVLTGVGGLRCYNNIMEIQQNFLNVVKVGSEILRPVHLPSLDSAVDNMYRVEGGIIPASSYTSIFYVGDEQVRAIKLFK